MKCHYWYGDWHEAISVGHTETRDCAWRTGSRIKDKYRRWPSAWHGTTHVEKWDYAHLLSASLYSWREKMSVADNAPTMSTETNNCWTCSHRLYATDISTLHNWQVFVNWSLFAVWPGNFCSSTAAAVQISSLGSDDLCPSVSHHGACHKAASFVPSYLILVGIWLTFLTISRKRLPVIEEIWFYLLELTGFDTNNFHNLDKCATTKLNHHANTRHTLTNSTAIFHNVGYLVAPSSWWR